MTVSIFIERACNHHSLPSKYVPGLLGCASILSATTIQMLRLVSQ